MSKHSSYEAVKRFVKILEQSGLRKRLELSDEDIADTLWLALQMGVENTQIRENPLQAPKETKTIPENTNIQPVEPVEPPINIDPRSPDLFPKKSENIEPTFRTSNSSINTLHLVKVKSYKFDTYVKLKNKEFNRRRFQLLSIVQKASYTKILNFN